MPHLETKSVDSEQVEIQWVFPTLRGLDRSWKRLRGLVERLGVFLKTSWSRSGADVVAAARDVAPAAACVAADALGRSWADMKEASSHSPHSPQSPDA